MKTKNLLMLLAISSIVFFASCKKDNSTPDPLTKAEAELAFTSAEANYNDIATTLDSQTGLTVMNSFENIGFPNTAKKVVTHTTLTGDDLKLLPSVSKGGGNFITDVEPTTDFDFNSIKGTWTYSTGWSKTNTEPTDKVVLIMPYGEGGTATLTFSEYQIGSVNGINYLSHLKAEYKISTQVAPVMTWEYSCTKSLTGESYQFIYNVGDYTKTKTYSAKGLLGKSEPTSSTVNWSVVWEKSGSIIHERSFTKMITYNSDQSEDYYIAANYRVKDIVVKWKIQYNSISTDRNNPNNYITITVWNVNGAKVADIIFKSSVAKFGYMLYIVFNDGTEVPLSNYIEILYEIIYSYTWYVSGQY